MRTLIYIVFYVLSYTCQAQTNDIQAFDTFQEWKKAREFHKDTVYIVNFWATWCQPCVKELPYFETFHHNFIHKPYKVILLSLDFKKQLNSHLIPFLKKNNIRSEVAVLTDTKYNDWMPLVHEEWSGAIPATWMIANGKDFFAERDFDSYGELEQFLSENIHSIFK